jgi:DNA-binding transcriptional MocR family regulator
MKAFDYTNAVRESDLPPTARWVYVALVMRYNHSKARATWVSQERLATDTGYSVSTVGRALKTLKESGWVDVSPRVGMTSLYAPLKGENLCQSDRGQGDLGVDSLGQSDVGSKGTSVRVTEGVRQSDRGGRSERPTNREVSSESNREEETPAAPVVPEEPTVTSSPSLEATALPASPSPSSSPVGQDLIENADLGQSDRGPTPQEIAHQKALALQAKKAQLPPVPKKQVITKDKEALLSW